LNLAYNWDLMRKPDFYGKYIEKPQRKAFYLFRCNLWAVYSYFGGFLHFYWEQRAVRLFELHEAAEGVLL